jgi:hypothetical protein
MFNLWFDIDNAMAKLRRENGKWLRRRATIRNDVDVDVLEDSVSPYTFAGVSGTPGDNVFRPAQTRRLVTRTTKKHSWFVGSFRYWIPDTGDKSLWDAKAKAALFGVLPTPELLWSVLPWSWLVDWFVNVDDVLSNLSANAVDNLVTRYSYVMQETQHSIVASSICSHPPGMIPGWQHWPAAQNVTFRSVYTETEKVRVEGGNPFGLNIDSGDLSGRQLGILAALGLNRVSR